MGLYNFVLEIQHQLILTIVYKRSGSVCAVGPTISSAHCPMTVHFLNFGIHCFIIFLIRIYFACVPFIIT